jgi:hypothetical protein
MAHYAFLDENNVVVKVITGVDENIIQTDKDGTQVGGSTEAWELFYESLPWFNGLKCKRTSYNGNFRYNYAGIGCVYDQEADAFIPPQPNYGNWILDTNTYRWIEV